MVEAILKKHKILEYRIVSAKRIALRAGYTELPLTSAKSCIIAALPYAFEDSFGGNISAYSAIRDYHDEAGEIIFALCAELEAEYGGSWTGGCDSTPLDEKYIAEISGLGARGRNTLIINERYGSYIFLFWLLSDKELPEYMTPQRSCDDCGMCEDGCPGKALSGGMLLRERCVAAITQRRGELEEGQKELIIKSGYAWGCDICQRLCPMNEAKSDAEGFFRGERCRFLTRENLPELMKTRPFAWRGQSTVERNLDILNGRIV